MVLVFFVVNLLRIDLYDVVKEIKEGAYVTTAKEFSAEERSQETAF